MIDSETLSSLRSQNEKDKKQKVSGRWLFHSVMTFNVLSAVFYSFYGFILLLLSVFIYDSTVVLREYFFKYHMMKNFTKVPNGELIDTCYKYGTVENYYNLKDQYLFFKNYTNDLKVLMYDYNK